MSYVEHPRYDGGQDWSEIPRDVALIRVDPSVEAIRNSTFRDLNQLEKVEHCEGPEEIEDSSFGNCKSLIGIKIPSTAGAIGVNAFSGGEQSEEAKLGDGLEQICTWAFYGCTSLKCIDIPSVPTAEAIQRGLPEKCSHLEEAELCEGIEETLDDKPSSNADLSGASKSHPPRK